MLIQILKEFPAIFAVIGLLVGGAIMFWVTKKFGPMRNDALNEVVKAYKEQVGAQIELARVQAEQHMITLTMQKEHWAEELGKLEKERDDYRNKLHDANGLVNVTRLKVQELELLPTVEVLQNETQAFYREMSATLQSISTALQKHDDKIDDRMAAYFEPLQAACSGTAHAMTELVKSLTKKRVRSVRA